MTRPATRSLAQRLYRVLFSACFVLATGAVSHHLVQATAARAAIQSERVVVSVQSQHHTSGGMLTGTCLRGSCAVYDFDLDGPQQCLTTEADTATLWVSPTDPTVCFVAGATPAYAMHWLFAGFTTLLPLGGSVMLLGASRDFLLG